MSGLPQPNYTQVPNVLLDKIMQDMGEAELKITLAIIRKIIGFHKTRDAISISQLVELTGMSRQGVVNGLTAAIKRGTVAAVAIGRRNVTVYELVLSEEPLVNEVDQSAKLNSTSQQSSTVTSQRSRHTKENSKDNLQKKKDSNSLSNKKEWEDVSHKTRTQIIEAWVTNLPAQPINIGNVYAITTHHRLAATLARAGYTAADVARYTAAVSQEAFWRDKGMKLKHVVDNLPAWIKTHPATTAPTIAPPVDETDIISPEKQEEARRMFEALVASKNANRKEVNHEV